jgi:carbonic anhydrase/acetyltransferase-like protein (isoleucine patch superfamily)
VILEFSGKHPRIEPGAFVAPTAVLIGDVTIREGGSIWYGAVLRADGGKIIVGRLSNIQDNCTLHSDEQHSVVLGERVTVGHQAVLHACTVDDDAVVGIGAVVLDGAVVERGALVAAGAVVLPGRVVPAGQVVRGVPAQPVGPVPPSLKEHLLAIPHIYMELAEKHRREVELRIRSVD